VSLIDFSQALAAIVAGADESVVGVGHAGSGFIFGQDRVVTNAHNLRQREKAEIHFSDGSSAVPTVLGVDEDGDLALVCVPTGGRPALAWPAAEGPALGELVVALARPRGRLQAGVGFVSAKDVPFQGPRGRVLTGAVEHTCTLVRGSSGGPLLDARGQLAGINTHREGEGFYLALPASADLKARAEALSRGEVPRRPRLGVALAPARTARRLREAVGLPPTDGLLVQAVEESGPAERAGIRRGDLIVSVDGKPTTTLEQLAAALEAAAPEGRAEVGLTRGVQRLTMQVDLAGEEPTSKAP